jgi:hypothetical protein
LKQLSDDVATKVDEGAQPSMGPIKQPRRAQDKITGDYKGDVTQIKDLARTSILADNESEMGRIADELEQRLGGNTDRKDTKTPEYSDIKFRPVINGIKTEIKVLTKRDNYIANVNHPLYEQMQVIERNANNQNRAMNEDELAKIAGIKEKMREAMLSA